MVTAILASQIPFKDLHVGLLLYGDVGVGKTHAVSLAPKPLVLLTEKNGLATIKVSNPDAHVVIVTNVQELREVIGHAMRGTLHELFGGKPEDVGTFVVDGLTEVQQLFKDDINSQKKGDDQQFSVRDWGTLADKMRFFMRTLRDLPYATVCTALVNQIMLEGDPTKYMRPLFQGKKTASEVAQYFSGVAYLFKRMVKEGDGDDAKEVVKRLAMFDGPSRYTCKPLHHLNGVVELDVNDWFVTLAQLAKDSDQANAASAAGEEA